MPSSSPSDRSRSPHRRILSSSVAVRLACGWAAVAALFLAAPLLAPPTPEALLATVLAGIVAVIVLCSFGVVHEAEALARRLGDPYGTLILTLSIVTIEAVLICAVMLGPGDHATIARDSVMAVSMIILNLVVGACLLVGGIRHGSLRINRRGALTYTALLVALSATAFAAPAVLGSGGAFTRTQALVVSLSTMLVYGLFLWQQTGARAADFQEPPCSPASSEDADAGRTAASTAAPIGTVLAVHRRELLSRTVLLIVLALPIVLLSHHMAALLDDALGRIGAPTALAGLLIAMIVFTPESITAMRAALGGEGQRVVNLCHGALVSTVGLTIPAVLAIGLLTGQQVVLAQSPGNLLLLGATLALTAAAAASRRVTALHGAAHLVLFGLFALMLLG